MAVVSKTPITGIDGTLTISNGVVTTVLPFTMGTLKESKINGGVATARKTVRTETDFFARGQWIGAKYTSDEIVEITFEAFLVGLKGVASDPVILDCITQTGDWAAAASTVSAAKGDVPHVTLTWTIERTNFGATTDDVKVWKYCSFSASIEESDEGSKLSLTARSKPNGTDSITVT